jgi:hypothetical protein
MIVFSWLLLIVTGLFGSVFIGFAQAQNSARDVERKTDINAIFQKLEEHYAVNGWYPTIDELTRRPEDSVPNLDPEALVDPEGNQIQDGGYLYLPSDCTALGCQSYELSAELEDGTRYVKNSLN